MKKFLMLPIFFLLLSTITIAHTEDNPFQTDLIAGQHTDVGDISVWNDENTLYVKYETFDGWCLIETHVSVVDSLEEIPQKNGNPIPGNFEYKEEHDCLIEYTYEVDLDDGILYIATHAVVKTRKKESSWAGDMDFLGKNWAKYFTYRVQKDWLLPQHQISMMLGQGLPGTWNNYFDLDLWNVGTGYNIFDGTWPGWCADSIVYIYGDVEYMPNVYSSLDPDLESKCPYCVNDEQWDYVNYILNHKYPGSTWSEIQAAVWYFTESNPDYQGYFTDKSQAMIDDALANGEGFYPVAGEFGAVLLAVSENVQLVFIEVDP